MFIFAALAAVTTLALIACSDKDESDDASPASTPTSQPASPTSSEPTRTPTVASTTTPTSEANTAAGFRAAVANFNKELATGTVDPLIARFKVIDYTCTAADTQPGLGQPECTTAGEKIRGFQTSNWRSEGGLRKVENVVANLKERQAGFDTTKSDAFGPGTFRVFAFDATKNSAVITVTSKCLPQFQCPPAGFQRLVWVPDFEYSNGRWMIKSLLYAFVLGKSS